jgi:hypothetical protein
VWVPPKEKHLKKGEQRGKDESKLISFRNIYIHDRNQGKRKALPDTPIPAHHLKDAIQREVAKQAIFYTQQDQYLRYIIIKEAQDKKKKQSGSLAQKQAKASQPAPSKRIFKATHPRKHTQKVTIYVPKGFPERTLTPPGGFITTEQAQTWETSIVITVGMMTGRDLVCGVDDNMGFSLVYNECTMNVQLSNGALIANNKNVSVSKNEDKNVHKQAQKPTNDL